MQNNHDGLQRKLSQLNNLVGYPGSPAIILDATPGRRSFSPPLVQPAQAPSGTLRAELATVEQQLESISVLATNEAVEELLTRKASLQLRLAAGERELAALSNEIALAQQIEHSNLVCAESERREEQRKRNVVVEQVREMDDLIFGRKLPPRESLRPGDTAQSAYARQIDYYKELRARVMAENGLTEADLPQAPVASPTQLRPDGSGWT